MNGSYPYDGYPVHGSEADVRVPRSFTKAETVFAWLSLFFGYLFCRVVPVHNNPFGGFLFILALFVGAAVLLALEKRRPTPLAIGVGVSAVLLSVSLFLTDNSVIVTFAYLYCLGALLYFLSAAYENGEKGFSPYLVFDFVRACFYLPILSVKELFALLFRPRENGGGRMLLKVFGGILLAIIPTAIVSSLLSYDSGFTGIIDRIFDFDVGKFFSHVFSVLFAFPIGAFLFGAMLSAKDKKGERENGATLYEEKLSALQLLPSLTATLTVLPILFLYVIFFISQWEYYTSGFVGALPDEVSYAEYAREGFFQLMGVAILNFILVIGISLFLKKKNRLTEVVQKLLCCLLSLSTLILISTAIAKMVLYIKRFGLTPKRVYATWFMGLLAVLFVLVIVRQFIRSFRLVSVSAVACILLFTLLALSGVDGIIADYNIDRYLEGSLEDADIEALEELGYAAVPALCRLAEHLDAKLGRDMSQWKYDDYVADLKENEKPDEQVKLYHKLAVILYRMAEEYEKEFFALSIPRVRAERAFEEIGIETGERDRSEDEDQEKQAEEGYL